jgi:hypothetical protein
MRTATELGAHWSLASPSTPCPLSEGNRGNDVYSESAHKFFKFNSMEYILIIKKKKSNLASWVPKTDVGLKLRWGSLR